MQEAVPADEFVAGTNVPAGVWKVFLQFGTSLFDLNTLRDAGRLAAMKREVQIIEATPGSGDTAYITDRGEFSNKLVSVFPGTSNIAAQVSQLVTAWIATLSYVPAPNAAQSAWLRWVLLSDGYFQTHGNFINTRILQPLSRGFPGGTAMQLDEREWLRGVMRRLITLTVPEISSGPDIDRYMEGIKEQERQLASKLTRFKANQVYQETVEDEVGERELISKKRDRNEITADQARLLISESSHRETRDRERREKSARLEESIRTDPYLIIALKSRKETMPRFLSRLAAAGKQNRRSPEEAARYNRERLYGQVIDVKQIEKDGDLPPVLPEAGGAYVARRSFGTNTIYKTL